MGSEWGKLRIKNVVSFVVDNRGKTPPTQDEGHILLEVNAVSATEKFPLYQEVRKHVSQEVYDTHFRKGHPQKGDILVPTVGTLGAVSLMNRDDCCIAQNLIALRCDEAICHSHFLYYVLCTPMTRKRLLNLNIGGVQPSIKVPHLMELEIELPSISEQKKIAELLSLLDDKIFCNKRINDNLQQQVYALYDAWFVSFSKTDGEMPADWREGTLGDIAVITSGKRPPMKQATASADVAIPLVGAASIMGFTNTVLYNKPILVTGRVGTHGVVQRFQSHCWTSDNTLVIKSDFYEFTFQVLQRVDYVNMNRGSTQPLITQTDLKNVPIVIPTDEVLLEYEKLAGSLMAMYESNRKENERLAILRDTLLPRLMSGEIDVSNIDI